MWHVAVERIVRRGLVGDDVDLDAAAQQFGEHVGGVALDPDRETPSFGPGGKHPCHGVVEVIGDLVEIAGLQPALDPLGINVDAKRHAVVHGDRQRLGTTHPAESAGQGQRAGQRSAEALLGDGGEGLIGPLEDALGADVDPRAGGHLAVHHQTGRFEFPEVLPVAPVGHQQAVGDQDPRRHLVGAEPPDRLAGLHQQRLVVVEISQVAHDGVECIPAPRRLAPAAVDDQLIGVLGHRGVEVVHQAAQCCLLEPSLGRQGRPARGRHRAWSGQTRPPYVLASWTPARPRSTRWF